MATENKEVLQSTNPDKSYSKSGPLGTFKTTSSLFKQHVNDTVDIATGRKEAPSGGGSAPVEDDEQWPPAEWLEDGLNHFVVDADIPNVEDRTLSMRFTGTGFVDWGDGTTDQKTDAEGAFMEHVYTTQGEYHVKTDMILEGESSGAYRPGVNSHNPRIIKLCAEVGAMAFGYNYTLKTVVIPPHAVTVGKSAFSNCAFLKNVIICDGVQSIGGNAFGNCWSLKNISLPNSVTTIGNAFDSCTSLTKIVIPEGVSNIESNTFSRCHSLSDVTLPSTLINLDDSFYECYSLKKVNLPDGLKKLSAFSDKCCNLPYIAIPDSVTHLGSAVLARPSLTVGVIPPNVVEIGNFAVRENLKALIVKPITPPSINDLTFYDIDCPIYVPDTSVGTYKTASYWSSIADRIKPLSECPAKYLDPSNY